MECITVSITLLSIGKCSYYVFIVDKNFTFFFLLIHTSIVDITLYALSR